MICFGRSVGVSVYNSMRSSFYTRLSFDATCRTFAANISHMVL